MGKIKNALNNLKYLLALQKKKKEENMLKNISIL